jgi:ferredoxin
MQTNFSLAQLADPNIAEADKILRACVHCGLCTATCPTYVLLGDELDSPRGRIYLIKEMLEHARPATADVVKHIDRCLSCLACMTTCPSGVHYMHLVDHARAYIEKTFRRPFLDRTMRAMLAWLMPYPARFRLALIAALAAKPFAPILEARIQTHRRHAAARALAAGTRFQVSEIQNHPRRGLGNREKIVEIAMQRRIEPVFKKDARAKRSLWKSARAPIYRFTRT